MFSQVASSIPSDYDRVRISYPISHSNAEQTATDAILGTLKTQTDQLNRTAKALGLMGADLELYGGLDNTGSFKPFSVTKISASKVDTDGTENAPFQVLLPLSVPVSLVGMF